MRIQNLYLYTSMQNKIYIEQKINIIQIQPFYEVDTSLYRPKYIDRGRSPRSIYISRSIYNLYRLNRKAVFFILLIDNFTVI
jgi:hypothetical protein